MWILLQYAVEPEVEEPEPAAAGGIQVASAGVAGVPESAGLEEYVGKLKALPQYNDFGNLFKTCPPVQLTEDDTEYSITVVKHMFENHIVFQFNCTNTIEEQILEDVSVAMDLAEAVRKMVVLFSPSLIITE